MTDKDKSLLLQQNLALDEIVADLLVKRGYGDVESARNFLYPDIANLTPLDKYDGVQEIAQRLKRAIEEGENIVVYGDYDCDGVCAVAILYGYLSKVAKNSNVSYFIPNRHNDGYGLSVSALDYIAENSDAQIVISVDCGINSVEEVDYAQQELGFEMLITDHHQPGEVLPDCLVFNPHVSAKEDAFRYLCGAGVALRIVEAIAGLDESKKYYDIAALATVADVVPLVGDNRIITHFGLVSINKKYRRGITLLVDSCIKGSVTSSDIAFRLAPRINAMGRVKDANEVVTLFTQNDFFLLRTLVDDINKANDIRQQMTDDLTQDCLDKLKDYDFENNRIIVLYAPYWDDGVLGIAASRIVGMFSRPVILFTKNKGMLKGSGRSVAGVNILECVKSAQSLLTRFGGHPMACGVGLEEKNFQAFVQTVNAYAASVCPPEAFDRQCEPDCVLEKPLAISVAKQLCMLQPFGEGNPAPVFAIDEKKCNFSKFGDGSHIKAKIKNMEVVGFGLAKEKDYFNSEAQKRFALEVSYNVFNNTERAQAIIKKAYPLGLPDDAVCAEYLLALRPHCDKKVTAKALDLSFACDMAKKPFGVCFVAFSRQSALKFAEQCGLKVTFGKPVDMLPRTQIVLCPQGGDSLAYYSEIVFLDEALYDDMYGEFTKDGEAYVCNLAKASDCFRDVVPVYDEYAAVYKAVKRATGSAKYSDVKKLYEAVACEINIDYSKFLICFYVFEELGLMVYNISIECVSGKKTDLGASKIYNALLAVRK